MSLCQSAAAPVTTVFRAGTALGTTKLPPMTTLDRSENQAEVTAAIDPHLDFFSYTEERSDILERGSKPLPW